jgi:hypothetical protein
MNIQGDSGGTFNILDGEIIGHFGEKIVHRNTYIGIVTEI